MCLEASMFDWKVDKINCNIEYPVSITVQYFQDCEGWWEVPDLWVHPDTASFARLYKCRPTEDQARKDKDELNTVLLYIDGKHDD